MVFALVKICCTSPNRSSRDMGPTGTWIAAIPNLLLPSPYLKASSSLAMAAALRTLRLTTVQSWMVDGGLGCCALDSSKYFEQA